MPDRGAGTPVASTGPDPLASTATSLLDDAANRDGERIAVLIAELTPSSRAQLAAAVGLLHELLGGAIGRDSVSPTPAQWAQWCRHRAVEAHDLPGHHRQVLRDVARSLEDPAVIAVASRLVTTVEVVHG